MSKELLAKLDEDLKLAGYAKRSRQSYVRAVRQLMNFWGCALEEVEEQQVREYWLHCKDELDWSGATMRISYSGIKFFFQHTLKRDWETLRLLKIKRQVTPPTVLSVDEVRKVLAALPTFLNQVFYTTVYTLGLRLGEARYLRPEQIDSERMCVSIRDAKGDDRLVPLPESTLRLLRQWYKSHRNAQWIFPAPGRDGKRAPSATQPVSETTVQGALRRTVKKLKITKHVHPHVFRHSYATHLLEAGVPIQHVQKCLGHRSLVTTMVYLHVTELGHAQSREKLNQLVRGVLS
jgi:integrase